MTITAMPPRIWKPTATELRAIRTYCAETECKRPGAITLEIGVRYNTEDASRPVSANIRRVTDLPEWCDTDLHDHQSWADFKRFGVDLDRKGRALVDLYIRDRSGLLGNAQVYVEAREGVPRVVGFAATMRPYEARLVDR